MKYMKNIIIGIMIITVLVLGYKIIQSNKDSHDNVKIQGQPPTGKVHDEKEAKQASNEDTYNADPIIIVDTLTDDSTTLDVSATLTTPGTTSNTTNTTPTTT
jgi:hypothetical protein